MKLIRKRFWHALATSALLAGSTACAQAAPLTIGTVSAASDDRSITLFLSAGLSGGSGVGYRYAIYRGASPDFVPSPTNRLALSETLASVYVDRAGLAPGRMYYYKVVGMDDAGDTAGALPEGLGGAQAAGPLSVAAALQGEAIDVVFIGDSITQGVGLTETANPCAVCADALRTLRGLHAVSFANQGHSGHTTLDYLPGAGDFAGAEDVARRITAGNSGRLVFSVMLGTNDSAETGPHGAAAPPDLYRANLKAIVDRLLADFPNCRVVLNHPLWYSPNTHNGSTYEQAGLARLTAYLPVLDGLAASYRKSQRGRVSVGDTEGFAYFAANYRTDLVPEDGRNGTFYLHPNARGAAVLGRLWASAIADTLFGRGR
jgi:lysophospholipase L1-like esterase